MEDARALDEVANDLSSDDVLYDHTFHTRSVHPIIQSCRAARARHGRKAAPDLRADLWARFRHFTHEDVRPLRTAAEATLPCDLGSRPHAVRVEGIMEHLLKCARSSSIAALRAAADDDLEPARRQAPSIAVSRSRARRE
jgi:hypothetical protein